MCVSKSKNNSVINSESSVAGCGFTKTATRKSAAGAQINVSNKTEKDILYVYFQRRSTDLILIKMLLKSEHCDEML